MARLAGCYIHAHASTADLVVALIVLLSLTAALAAIILLFPTNGTTFAVISVLISLVYANIIPFVFGLVNQITYPTTISSVLLVVGMGSGSVLLPFWVSFIWSTNSTIGSAAIMITVLGASVCSIPLVASLESMTYCSADGCVVENKNRFPPSSVFS